MINFAGPVVPPKKRAVALIFPRKTTSIQFNRNQQTIQLIIFPSANYENWHNYS
jgi:hypothetical protein